MENNSLTDYQKRRYEKEKLKNPWRNGSSRVLLLILLVSVVLFPDVSLTVLPATFGFAEITKPVFSKTTFKNMSSVISGIVKLLCSNL